MNQKRSTKSKIAENRRGWKALTLKKNNKKQADETINLRVNLVIDEVLLRNDNYNNLQER